MRRYELPDIGSYRPAVPRKVALVTTDGSCVTHGQADASRGCGGWAAIVEHGSEGHVLRGREPVTTATRMEVLAVVEALRSLPEGTPVVVRTDALVVEHLHHGWVHGRRVPQTSVPADRALRQRLYDEFGRLGTVQVVYVSKKDRVLEHTRCHKLAGLEARGLAIDMGLAKQREDTAVAEAFREARRRRRQRQREDSALSDTFLELYREDELRRRDQVGRSRRAALERRADSHFPC